MRIRRSTTVAAATLTLLSPLVAVLTPASATGITFISFEDVPAACSFNVVNPLRDRYAAAKFRGPNADDGGAVLDTCSNFGVSPHTGSRFLAFNPPLEMANGGSPRGPAKIRLTTPQKKVTIWVSQAGFNVGDATFKLVGRKKGETIRTATTSVTTSAWVALTVSSRKRFDSLVLSAPVEPDGAFLVDDLTMVS